MMGSEFTKLQDLDIVCGRGKSYDSFPGNAIFKRLVRQYSEVYSERERLQKAVVIQQIAKQLQASNIRFVKRAFQGRWVLLSDEEVSVKIGHALRDVRTVRKRQAKKAERKRRASTPGDVPAGGGEERHSSGSSSLDPSSGSSTSTSPFPADPTFTAQPNSMVLDSIARGETPSVAAASSNEGQAAASYLSVPGSLAAAVIPMPTILEQHQLSLMNTMCAYPPMPATTPIFWNTLPSPYLMQASGSSHQQASHIATSNDDSSRPLDLRTSASWEGQFTLDDVADILDACCDDEVEPEQGEEEDELAEREQDDGKRKEEDKELEQEQRTQEGNEESQVAEGQEQDNGNDKQEYVEV